MNRNKISIKSFFKSSPTIINFILKAVDKNKITTIKQIKDLILDEFKTNVSIQLIYNLKKMIMYIRNLNLIIIRIL